MIYQVNGITGESTLDYQEKMNPEVLHPLMSQAIKSGENKLPMQQGLLIPKDKCWL